MHCADGRTDGRVGDVRFEGVAFGVWGSDEEGRGRGKGGEREGKGGGKLGRGGEVWGLGILLGSGIMIFIIDIGERLLSLIKYV